VAWETFEATFEFEVIRFFLTECAADRPTDGV
jgi:hypothetical protein